MLHLFNILYKLLLIITTLTGHIKCNAPLNTVSIAYTYTHNMCRISHIISIPNVTIKNVYLFFVFRVQNACAMLFAFNRRI